jgi:hypothetical protein
MTIIQSNLLFPSSSNFNELIILYISAILCLYFIYNIFKH